MSTSLELINLEQLLEGDCNCESKTHDNGAVKCSRGATHLLQVSCVQESIKVCANMAAHVNSFLPDGFGECSACDVRVDYCWTIRPI